MGAWGQPAPGPSPVAAPAVVAAGNDAWLWIIELRHGTDPTDSQALPTQILARKSDEAWKRPRLKHLTALRTVAAVGDRLHVFLPDGRQFIYSADGPARASDPLPPGFVPVEAAGEGDRLLALGVREQPPVPTSQPTTDSEPVLDILSPVATRPDRPATREFRLFEFVTGSWKALPSLPADVVGAQAVSLAVVRGRAVLLYVQDEKLGGLELGDDGWRTIVPLGETALSPATAPDGELPEHGRRMPPVADVVALTVDGRLYAICLPPPVTGNGMQIAAITDRGVTRMGDLSFGQPHDGNYRRYVNWDVAVHGKRLVFVRVTGDDPNDRLLETRLYDPHNRTVDGPAWVKITPAKLPAWTQIFQSQWFVIVIIILLGAMLLMRRPTTQIRIPADAAPASMLARTFAALLDLIPPSMVAGLLIFGADPANYPRFHGTIDEQTLSDPRMLQVYYYTVGLLVAYRALAESIFGTTLGKRLFGLSVRSVSGSSVNAGQAIVRNLVLGLELLIPFVPFLVLLMTIMHPAHLRVGDMVAGSIVLGPRRWRGPWVQPPRRDDNAPPDDKNPD